MKEMIENFFMSPEFQMYNYNDQMSQIQMSLSMFRSQLNKLQNEDHKHRIGMGTGKLGSGLAGGLG